MRIGCDFQVTSNFKIFVFCLAAVFSAIGGAMFTLQVGFMSPTFVGIVPSIEMVIFCAVGGRLSILGAVYGALLVNWTKTSFSETFPELWLFAMGALFIGVVLAFPNGIAGLYQQFILPYMPDWFFGKGGRPSPDTPPDGSGGDTPALASSDAAKAKQQDDDLSSDTSPAMAKGAEPASAVKSDTRERTLGY